MTLGPSEQTRRHVTLRRKILLAHPEVRALAGPEPLGLPAALLLLALHWTIAGLLAESNLPIVFLTAFLVGQVILHATGALIHETAHRLVFRGPRAKLAFDLLLEVITTSFARQLTYQHEHVSSHHARMGDYEGDYEHEDACRFLARRSLRRSRPRLQRVLAVAQLMLEMLPLGFLISGEIFPRLYGALTGHRPKDIRRDIGASQPTRARRLLFMAVSLAANLTLLFCFGFLGWLYHIWSLSIFLGKAGVTNLGQSLSEHPGDDERNPTRSTYWWGNAFLFNTGYHNEHHTFPNVPWSRLPELRNRAPGHFNVESRRSYFRCWWDHTIEGFDLPSRRNPVQASDLSERCKPVG